MIYGEIMIIYVFLPSDKFADVPQQLFTLNMTCFINTYEVRFCVDCTNRQHDQIACIVYISLHLFR